jgi:DNA replication protein DnaC
MPVTDNKEDLPEYMECEKHGRYPIRFTEMNSKYFYTDYCPKCAYEQNQIEKARDKAHAERIKKDMHDNKRTEAGISKRNLCKTFEAYQCDTKGQYDARNSCESYVADFPHGRSMLMVGGVGTGKTLLASAMINQIVDKHSCEIIKLIDIVRELKATWSRDSNTSEEKLIKYYSNIDLLVIDEVGSQFGSDTEKLFIFDIIDGRYQNMKPTVLISNLDINGIKEAIGERCVDRLREDDGVMIAFDWASSRV